MACMQVTRKVLNVGIEVMTAEEEKIQRIAENIYQKNYLLDRIYNQFFFSCFERKFFDKYSKVFIIYLTFTIQFQIPFELNLSFF